VVGERVRRIAALFALPALAILVTVVGVFALLSTRASPRATSTSTATPAATATAAATAITASPTFTPTSSLPGNDWLEYRADAASTGVNGETIITPSNVASMTQVWKGDNHQAYMGGSAVVGDVVYVANGNTFFALDLHTGKALWTSSDLPQKYGPISSTVAVDPQLGLAFYGTPDAQVYAVNIRTGQMAWHTILGDPSKNGHIWSSPLVINNHVYIGLSSLDDQPCVRSGVFSLAEQTGAIAWSHYTIRAGRTGGGVWSSVDADPALHEILATSGNPCPIGPVNPTIDETDSFLALDWDTGQTLWQYTAFGNDDCDCDFGQGPVNFVYQGQPEVIGGNKNGFVYGLRPPATRSGTPTLLWKTQISVMGYYKEGGIYEPPTYLDGVAYIAGGPTPDGACTQGSLNAIRVTDGAVLWRVCTSGQVASASVLTEGMLFVAQYDTVVAYDITNGHTLWSAKYLSDVWGGLALAHGHLLVPLVSGNLICFAIPGVSP
jgi:outer membrane protein assembly factor BamB